MLKMPWKKAKAKKPNPALLVALIQVGQMRVENLQKMVATEEYRHNTSQTRDTGKLTRLRTELRAAEVTLERDRLKVQTLLREAGL